MTVVVVGMVMMVEMVGIGVRFGVWMLRPLQTGRGDGLGHQLGVAAHDVEELTVDFEERVVRGQADADAAGVEPRVAVVGGEDQRLDALAVGRVTLLVQKQSVRAWDREGG